MRKKIIIKLVIVFFVFAPFSRVVLALPAVPESKQWCIDFSSRYDTSRSFLDRVDNQIVLEQRENGQYSNSGVALTNEVRFSSNIYSIYLTGSYSQPSSTQVKVLAIFDNNGIKEYFLPWNSFFYPPGDFRNIRLKLFLATENTNITPAVDEICLNLELLDFTKRGIKRRDDKRVRDLEKMVRLNNDFHEDFNRYPTVNIKAREKERQWEILRNVFTSASSSYFTNYERGFVEQIKGVDWDYQYGYLSNNSGSEYVFWTRLEDVNSSHFEDSWPGQVLGVNCVPPIFCLSSKSNQVAEVNVQYFDEPGRVRRMSEVEFVKKENDPKVWLKLGNYRFWLRTPEIFSRAGGDWDKISFQSNIEDVPLLKFIKREGKEDVYLVTESGFKRKLLNLEILYLYGSPLEIVELKNDNFFNILPNNYLIRAQGQSEVYFLDQGIKRWVSSLETFEKLGLYWDEVVEVHPRELDYYPTATPLF